MRKIMAILMAMVVLAGICAVTPAIAVSDALVDETFESFNESGLPAGWAVLEGNGTSVSQVDGGVEGKALQLTGDTETDAIKLRKQVTYAGWTAYEASAKYKVISYEGGNGFRMYFEDASTGTKGASNYATATTESYKSLVFEMNYDYDAERTGDLIIELSGKGTVLVDEVVLIACSGGLIPNGDFEADTYSSRTVVSTTVTAGIEREADGNGVAYIEGKTWNEGVNLRYGDRVTPGKTYIISFRYKNSSGVQPCLYLYFGIETSPTSTYHEMVRTEYHPNFADVTDGKASATPTADWKTFYASFTVPADGVASYNYRRLNYISIKGNNSATRSYFDDIRFMEATPGMEYTTTKDVAVESIAAAGETLRTRCFFVKDAAKESETVMLVQCVYEEDNNGVRSLIGVNINKQSVTTKNQYITVENVVPEAEPGKTMVAESFLWNGTGSLMPIIDEITLN